MRRLNNNPTILNSIGSIIEYNGQVKNGSYERSLSLLSQLNEETVPEVKWKDFISRGLSALPLEVYASHKVHTIW